MTDELHGPLFRVGDKVKIRGIGDVHFQITGLLSSEGFGYVYELNGVNRYYTEDVLEPVDDNNTSENADDYQVIALDINFGFDDIVTVKGYGDDHYKVEGYRIESWHYKDEEWSDVIYELSRIHDRAWLEAADDELQLVKVTEQGKSNISNESEVIAMLDEEEKRKEQERLDTIDRCLDAINTCEFLHNTTGDCDYLHEQAKAYDRLRELTKKERMD